MTPSAVAATAAGAAEDAAEEAAKQATVAANDEAETETMPEDPENSDETNNPESQDEQKKGEEADPNVPSAEEPKKVAVSAEKAAKLEGKAPSKVAKVVEKLQTTGGLDRPMKSALKPDRKSEHPWDRAINSASQMTVADSAAVAQQYRCGLPFRQPISEMAKLLTGVAAPQIQSTCV